MTMKQMKMIQKLERYKPLNSDDWESKTGQLAKDEAHSELEKYYLQYLAKKYRYLAKKYRYLALKYQYLAIKY